MDIPFHLSFLMCQYDVKDRYCKKSEALLPIEEHLLRSHSSS